MELTSETALANARKSKSHRIANKLDARFRSGSIFPSLQPSFSICRGDKIFTIGSCFARHIETMLVRNGYVLPTDDIRFPKEEWAHEYNGLLNEYNAGTIAQRIERALTGEGYGAFATAPSGDVTIDLLLPSATGVTNTRLIERRAEIDDVYTHLRTSEVTIITLGLVEAWFDHSCNLFLNRVPPFSGLRSNDDRYSLVVLDVDRAYDLLERAFGALIESGMKKIMLTVSPVPLHTTFTGQDCSIANAYSKSTLRVVADKLTRRFPEVDYFPSFEIVTFAGAGVFHDDNVHVLPGFVREITAHMISAYEKPREGTAETPETT